MPYYEFKVVPAPEKTQRVKGLKGADRFAYALESILCDMGAEGWDYIRADTLPDTERKGLTGHATVTRNMLIFRREIFFEEEEAAGTPEPDLAAPVGAEPAPAASDPAPVEPDTWRAPDRRLVADPADRAAE